jgi:Flp pilus assembly pilin Flp
MVHLLCKLERSLCGANSALRQLWSDESGQDVAEYSVMLAVILVIVVGTIRLIGSNASNIFSQVGSAIQ